MPLPQEDYTHTHTDTVYSLSVFLSLSLSGYHSDYRLNLQVSPPLLQELFVKAFSLILCSTTGKCKH